MGLWSACDYNSSHDGDEIAIDPKLSIVRKFDLGPVSAHNGKLSDKFPEIIFSSCDILAIESDPCKFSVIRRGNMGGSIKQDAPKSTTLPMKRALNLSALTSKVPMSLV